MLFKLSVQNLKKSMRDYAIYFFTLILGVAIFYVFNSLEKQTIMLKTSSADYEIIELMNSVMSGISVFVAFVLGCLIVYASNFLMKRRKKEFGIYMLLGMEKGKIARILMIETIFIGLISLGAGLTLGIVVSQGMSMLVIQLFEADMSQFEFIVSKSAIGKTVLYFVLMYVVVLLLDVFVVGKSKLINLIHAEKKVEKNTAKNPVFCAIVFLIAIVVLGSAYYRMTAEATEITETWQLMVEIGKGVVATFLIFWSGSGMFLFVVSRRKKFYLRGLNCFTVRELEGRFNTTVISGSIICLMLFVTICVLSSAMSMRESVNHNLKEMTPVDVNFDMDIADGQRIEDILTQTGVDTGMFRDVISIQSYTAADQSLTVASTIGAAFEELQWDDSVKDYYREMLDEVIKVSDYNAIARRYGLEEYTLDRDEYMVVANFDSMVSLRNLGLEKGQTLTIGGRTYHPKYKECQDGYIVMASNHTNFGFILVPDDVNLEGYRSYYDYYVADYQATSSMSIEEISTYIDSAQFNQLINPENKTWPSIEITTKTDLYANSISLTAMIVFIGIYLGIVFMISSAAILALKELSEAVDNKEKYVILRRIGVDEKDMNRSILAQSALFFGMPLLLACIHSIFGIQVCNYVLETFGKSGLLYSIIVTAVLIVFIYGIYFLITYLCSKQMIREKRTR